MSDEVRYKGLVLVFEEGGLALEEAEEVERIILRELRFDGKVKMACLSEKNDEDEIVKKRVTSEFHRKLFDFLFSGERGTE